MPCRAGVFVRKFVRALDGLHRFSAAQASQAAMWRAMRSAVVLALSANSLPETFAKRLAWARAVAVGPNVRTIDGGDQVLFDPEAPGHVELQGREYLLLRERGVHAVAGTRHSDAGTGLYL
jgi:chaperonin GroES